MQNAPVLSHPDFLKHFAVYTDASKMVSVLYYGKTEGQWLLRVQDSAPQKGITPLGSKRCLKSYMHYRMANLLRRLSASNQAEKRSSTLDLLAHQRGIGQQTEVTWAEYLARFNSEWEHIAGHKNIADVLNRKPCSSRYVTTRSQAHQATDAVVDPSGEASTGPRLAQEVKRDRPGCPHDEEPEATSPISLGGETGSAGVPEEQTSHSELPSRKV